MKTAYYTPATPFSNEVLQSVKLSNLERPTPFYQVWDTMKSLFHVLVPAGDFSSRLQKHRKMGTYFSDTPFRFREVSLPVFMEKLNEAGLL